jgi:hypothetical protein
MIQSQTIKMTSTPLYKNSITAKKVLDLKENSFFYDKIYSQIDDRGWLYIFDFGNKRMHIFDDKGTHQIEFGKEGNGPGELNGFFESMHVTDKHIILNNRRILVFTKEGKFVNEIPRVIHDHMTVKKNQIYFYKGIEYPSREKVAVYNMDGTIVKTIPNENYEAMTDDVYSPNNLMNTLIDRMKKPQDFQEFESGFMQQFAGSYKIEILDKNFKHSHTLIRDFEKVDEIIDRNIQIGSKGHIVKEARRIVTGGKKSDITKLLGTVNGHILVSVATRSNKEIKIDIINSDFEFVDQIEIEGDKYTDIQLKNDRLLISRTSREIGPYLDVYKLVF